MFTNEGLRLFAMWEQSPANKKRISSLAVGTLTDAQAEADDLYDGTETDLHNTTEYQRVAIDSVSVAETDDSVAIIRAIVTPAAAIQGKTIREVGLFAPNENNVEQLIWIDKFPATYIPNPESEPDVQGSLVVTVPIKFNNASAIEIDTHNTAMVTRAEFEDALADFVPVYLMGSADNSELQQNNVSYCVRFNPDGTYDEYAGNQIDTTLLAELQNHNYFYKIGDKNGNCIFDKSGRLNFSCNIYGLGVIEQVLHFDFCLRITAETHTRTSINPSPIVPLYFVVCNDEFWVTYYNGRPYPIIFHPPRFGCGFFIPFK